MTPIKHHMRDPNLQPLKATSNYADYDTHQPYVCCGWMDFHIDDDFGKNKPFVIKVISSHPDARLVHRVNNRYVQDELPEGKIIAFDHNQKHALLPTKYANRVIEKQRSSVKGYKQWAQKIDGNAFKAKLIWEWV